MGGCVASILNSAHQFIPEHSRTYSRFLNLSCRTKINLLQYKRWLLFPPSSQIPKTHRAGTRTRGMSGMPNTPLPRESARGRANRIACGSFQIELPYSLPTWPFPELLRSNGD